MSSVGVAVSVDLEAHTSVVSQVSSASWEVGESLVVLVGPWSDDSGVSNSVGVSVLVGDSIVSSLPASDGSGSGIEDEPLVVAE